MQGESDCGRQFDSLLVSPYAAFVARRTPEVSPLSRFRECFCPAPASGAAREIRSDHLVGEAAAPGISQWPRRRRNAEPLVCPQREPLQQRCHWPRVPNGPQWRQHRPVSPRHHHPRPLRRLATTPRSSSLCPLPGTSGPPEMGATGSICRDGFTATATSRRPTSVTRALWRTGMRGCGHGGRGGPFRSFAVCWGRISVSRNVHGQPPPRA